MKKQMLFVAGLLLLSASVTFAQDSTNTSPVQKGTNAKQSPSSGDQNYAKDMSKIMANDIPASLKQTLSSPEYKGWEQGTIYRSKNNDAYVVEMTTNGKMQAHRFGVDGKLIKEN